MALAVGSSATIDLGASKYGARGDGGDDSGPLLAWRNDILAALDEGASGVHAIVPAGVFALGRPVSLDILGDNVHLEGQGRGGSVLTQLPRTNADIVQTRGYGSGGMPASGFSITNLTIDGNAARQTAVRWCLAIRGFNYDIDSVDLLHGGAGGLSSAWTEDGVARHSTARIRALGCHEYAGLAGSSAPTYGILWAGPHDSQFSDVILSTLAAAQPDTGGSYGFVQASGASGEYITNMHVWGRHHYGIWADPRANGIHLANVVAEGAFEANAVIGDACTWSGGEVYGTLGNAGTQPHEAGISLGIEPGASHAPTAAGLTDGFTCSGSILQALRAWSFASPGTCVDFSNSAGGNIVTAVCATGGSDHRAALYRGAPNAGDEVFLSDPGTGARLIQRLVQ